MLNIREIQMKSLTDDFRSEFLDEMAQALRISAPQDAQDIPDSQVREEIERVAQQAETFGLGSFESIGIYLQVANDIGSDFPRRFNFASEVLNSDLDELTKRIWLQKWHEAMIAG